MVVDKMTHLMPCPFCGEEKQLIIFPLNLSPGLAQRVKCQKCDSQAVKCLWNNQKLRQEIIDEIDEILNNEESTDAKKWARRCKLLNKFKICG